MSAPSTPCRSQHLLSWPVSDPARGLSVAPGDAEACAVSVDRRGGRSVVPPALLEHSDSVLSVHVPTSAECSGRTPDGRPSSIARRRLSLGRTGSADDHNLPVEIKNIEMKPICFGA